VRDLADQNSVLPYVLTLFVAAFFLVFGLYALSAAGDLRRLPLLRPVLGFVAIVYLLRATLLGGISDLLAGHVKQVCSQPVVATLHVLYVW